MRKTTDIAVVIVAAIIAMAAMGACSPNKNTAASRKYQAFITRYNIYFNGDEHYKETLADMERNYEDDYSKLVYMHPSEAFATPTDPQPQGDFKRSIEKAQKAIQLRSIKKRPAKKSGKSSSDPDYKAWMKRDEYNPFLHNAWMMMGRSQYHNGDYLGASSTFFYVSKHFTWLPQTVTEAKIRQALSYVALDWLFEAETILKRIKPDELTSSALTGLYNFTYADFYVKSGDFEQALPYLEKAINSASGAQKTRLTFLLGQLQQRLGNKSAAYEAFRKAGASSSASYRTKFNARIKQSEVFDGSDITSEVNALKRMTRYDRNADYLDQIYYAIGNLYMSRRDTTKAIDNYKLALDKSKRNGIDKAIAALTLGGLYFDRHRYDLAQECYSQAITLIQEDYPDYTNLKRRSDVLDELAVYAQNVVLQDSLLKLAELTPEQQQKVVEKIIADLKKKEKEEAEAQKREEYLAQQAANGTGLQQNGNAAAPSTFTQNSDKSWYFYNTATRNAGKTEFQKRWGSRKLEDDWRRRNKAAFSFDEFNGQNGSDGESGSENDNDGGGEQTPEEEAAEKLKQEHENDPHFPEYYLKQIPKDDLEKATSHEVIQDGLYNMGVILKDKLEDFPSAEIEFNRLLERYPDNTYRLETYYNLYLMAIRQGNAAEAERWRRMVVDEFPETTYGIAMSDPNYFDNLREMERSQETLYAQTYDDYLNNRNDNVHRAYQRMEQDFPLSKIMPKFMFLDALAYVTENRPDEFNTALRTLLERYPDTDLTPLASAYLKGMGQGRKLHAGISNLRGMVWAQRLSNDSTETSIDGEPIEFDFSPEQPQQLVLLFPADSVSANQLLYDIARHNFNSFVVRDFDLEVMNFGNLGMLIIKEFANQNELDHYRRLLNADVDLHLPESVIPVMISVKNFEALLKGGGTFEQYLEAIGSDILKKTEAKAGADGPPTPPPGFETPQDLETELEFEAEAEDEPTLEIPNEPTPEQPETLEPTPETTPEVKPEPTPATPKQSVPDTKKPEKTQEPEKKGNDVPEGSEGDDDDDDDLMF